MAELVRHTHLAGNALTHEQIARLDKAAKQPIRYTADCPRLTDEQLAEFQPVNFASMDERTRAMQEVYVTKDAEPLITAMGK
jgi:hypothetical protein